ncbi:hypothetical protein D3C78_1462570 [compost metagenome]
MTAVVTVMSLQPTSAKCTVEQRSGSAARVAWVAPREAANSVAASRGVVGRVIEGVRPQQVLLSFSGLAWLSDCCRPRPPGGGMMRARRIA